MRAAFILNPAAKNGRARRKRDSVLSAAAAAGIEAHLVETEYAGHEVVLARELAGTFDTVVAVGGDGTIQGAVNGLAGTDTVLGVIPMGTGNDFAHALGMPSDINAAVRALVDAPRKKVDLGRVRWLDRDGTGEPAVQERLFSNCLGMGFDALAALGAAKTKWVGGRSAYVVAVLQALWVWRHPNVSVEIRTSHIPRAPGDESMGLPEGEGETLYSGPLFLCEVGNGYSVGGGFLLTPDARIDDGLLDVCVARHFSIPRALRILPTAFSGTHVRFPEVQMDRMVRVTIRVLEGDLPVQADGEGLSSRASLLDAEIWPCALHVIAPGLRGN